MTILFLCTGNSCRSQMAEGFARELAGDGVKVTSAGVEAHGLNPRAVTVMAERGIDISSQTSDIFEPSAMEDGDLIVTVCDRARASCPTVPGTIRQIHWSFDDPARATGTEDQILAVFRRVRDEIAQEVKTLFDVVPLSRRATAE